uniref:Secreted protein n=1 Tax=Spongospora subterranea TaxID=70186 RepID=A0A0H5R8L1_9EUKA|eukprot:CRZ10463.1 hypothetical protein [Spongospora subterranea]
MIHYVLIMVMACSIHMGAGQNDSTRLPTIPEDNELANSWIARSGPRPEMVSPVMPSNQDEDNADKDWIEPDITFPEISDWERFRDLDEQVEEDLKHFEVIARSDDPNLGSEENGVKTADAMFFRIFIAAVATVKTHLSQAAIDSVA